MKFAAVILALSCAGPPCPSINYEVIDRAREVPEYRALEDCLRTVFEAEAALGNFYGSPDTTPSISPEEFVHASRALENRTSELTASVHQYLLPSLADDAHKTEVGLTLAGVVNDLRAGIYSRYHSTGLGEVHKRPVVLSETEVAKILQEALTCETGN